MASVEKEPAVVESGVPDESKREDASSDVAEIRYTEPADQGAAAWTFLLGGFLVELMSWGFQLSFGVLEDYYASNTDFDKSLIPYIGTLAGGINYLACPIVIPLSTYKPSTRKPLMYAGLFLCVVGSIGASFATQAWHLVLGQGVLYGIGVSIQYLPIFGMLFEWFDKRRGFAAGIMFAGGGMSGVAFPFAFDWALHTHGSAFALRAWAVLLAVVLAPIIFFTRSRGVEKPSVPEVTSVGSEAAQGPARKPRNLWAFLRSKRFWLFSFATLFQGLGFYLPTIWVPSYATALGLSTKAGTALQTTLNISCVVGQIIVGHLSDSLDICVMLGLWQIGTAITMYLGWGFSRNLAGLVIFSILYGLFAGGFSSFWPRLAKAIPSCRNDELQSSLAFGLMSGWRGVGYLVSGYLSNALMKPELASFGGTVYALQPYGPLILFCGTAFMVASLGGFGKLSKT